MPEIHSVVACLDDLGPLALATSELVRAGVLTQTHLPWVVSVHDLLVFLHFLERREHFLTYLTAGGQAVGPLGAA